MMNKSVFFVLTRGSQEDWEALLNSLRNIEGVKVVSRFSEDVVSLKVERGIAYRLRIGLTTPSAVERLVKTSVNDWSGCRADSKAEKSVNRVLAYLGSGKSDRLPQYVAVGILPSKLTTFVLSEPPIRYVKVGSGRAVIINRYWGQKARSPGTGFATLAILNKDVSVKGLCGLINHLIRRRNSSIRLYNINGGNST
jgi:hypothetical protein